jgi:hypothetical protein
MMHVFHGPTRPEKTALGDAEATEKAFDREHRRALLPGGQYCAFPRIYTDSHAHLCETAGHSAVDRY